MSIPGAVAALAAVLCVLNLVLTFGVIRRLREHTTLLSARGRAALDNPLVEIGTPAEPFSTVTVDDVEIDGGAFTGKTTVAFFSPDCEPCREKLPRFVDYAKSLPNPRESLLVAVVGDRADGRGFIDALSPYANVVSEQPFGPLGRAFGVRMYPTVLQVEPDERNRLVVVDNDVVF
ncbi:TlpA family protein disulfide reductase [Actinomadura litoris]|uniref:TlpA family protein disulfide reductase n=1 Tax=Actinomadura litoris TaxID=2678616 RepID=UPI001FA6C551|nr:hypothetical protein [Actinomadura litoris]